MTLNIIIVVLSVAFLKCFITFLKGLIGNVENETMVDWMAAPSKVHPQTHCLSIIFEKGSFNSKKVYKIVLFVDATTLGILTLTVTLSIIIVVLSVAFFKCFIIFLKGLIGNVENERMG